LISLIKAALMLRASDQLPLLIVGNQEYTHGT